MPMPQTVPSALPLPRSLAGMNTPRTGRLDPSEERAYLRGMVVFGHIWPLALGMTGSESKKRLLLR